MLPFFEPLSSQLMPFKLQAWTLPLKDGMDKLGRWR
jgi:hypothetical protein